MYNIVNTWKPFPSDHLIEWKKFHILSLLKIKNGKFTFVFPCLIYIFNLNGI